MTSSAGHPRPVMEGSSGTLVEISRQQVHSVQL
jgi:hypothetical protein